MKNLLTPAILLVAMALTFTSCKKDEEITNNGSSNNTTTPAETKTQLLTARYWKLTAATISPAIDVFGNGNFITDIHSVLPPCFTDNLYKFNENSSTINDEGPTKCDPSDLQTTTGGWSWDSTQTIITWDGIEYTIMELTATTLKLRYVYEEYNENYDLVTYTDIYTYTRQ